VAEVQGLRGVEGLDHLVAADHVEVARVDRPGGYRRVLVDLVRVATERSCLGMVVDPATAE
jgi:hypothetical protein